MPDVTMFIKYTVEENGLICIYVSEGANKPYYLKAKGLKPSGVLDVYKRQLVGYGGGLEMKKALLTIEGCRWKE